MEYRDIASRDATYIDELNMDYINFDKSMSSDHNGSMDCLVNAMLCLPHDVMIGHRTHKHLSSLQWIEINDNKLCR